jgi:hypothetical protein
MVPKAEPCRTEWCLSKAGTNRHTQGRSPWIPFTWQTRIIINLGIAVLLWLGHGYYEAQCVFANDQPALINKPAPPSLGWPWLKMVRNPVFKHGCMVAQDV